MVDISRNNQIILFQTSLNYSPLDATTYYFGAIPQPSTGSSVGKIWFDFACRIIEANINVLVNGTLGSAETFTASVRKNDTTDTAITTAMQHDTVLETFNSGGSLSVDCAAGDFVNIKVVTPTWVTNPTLVFYSGQFVIERP